MFDAATGAGVGGVKVELLKGATPFYETTTDGGGRYRIDNIKEGDYAVRYQSPDYWLTAGPSDYRTFHVASGDPREAGNPADAVVQDLRPRGGCPRQRHRQRAARTHRPRNGGQRPHLPADFLGWRWWRAIECLASWA